MSLFDALVLFCMRGEQDGGYEFDNIYFCSQTYFAPGYSRDTSDVVSEGVNNETGTCHTSA